MIRNFLSYFNESVELDYSDDLYSDFLSQLGGRRFGNGLFNSFSADNAEKWENMIGTMFVGMVCPELKNKFKLFGYDWLGRCLGIDLREASNGSILMFEIGTNDILEIPLCLGGEDTIQNLELSDMEVYWVAIASKLMALRFKGQETTKEKAKKKTDWTEEIFEYIKMTLDLFRNEYHGFEAVKLVFTKEDSPKISFRKGENWIDIDFWEMQYRDGKDRDNYRECYYRDEVVWYEYMDSECPQSLEKIASQVCQKVKQRYGVDVYCETCFQEFCKPLHLEVIGEEV